MPLKNLDSSGLTSPIGTKQSKHLTLPNIKIDTPHGVNPFVGLPKPSNPYGGHKEWSPHNPHHRDTHATESECQPID